MTLTEALDPDHESREKQAQFCGNVTSKVHEIYLVMYMYLYVKRKREIMLSTTTEWPGFSYDKDILKW